jgi:hypothetical protein
MLILLSCTLLLSSTNAQKKNDTNELPEKVKIPKTFIKANIISPFIKNYGFQLEQVLSKRISIAVGYRTMPKGNLPLKSNIVAASGGSTSTEDALDALMLQNTAITPEIRFYVGKKGYGRGFYMAPFFRSANYKVDGLTFDYTNASNVNSSIALSGELKTATFGLQLGAQWSIGKNVCLDWWILGPHYGNANGVMTGKSSIPLSATEQSSLNTELNNFSVPLADVSHTVNASGATINITGPWAGIKAGLMLGIKF